MNQDPPLKSPEKSAESSAIRNRMVVLSASQMMLMFVGCSMLGLLAYKLNPAIAYVFIALAAAIVTVGILGGVANVKNRFGTFGGAAGVFVTVLLLLFQFNPQEEASSGSEPSPPHVAEKASPEESIPPSPDSEKHPSGLSRASLDRRVTTALQFNDEINQISVRVNKYLHGEGDQGLIERIEGTSHRDIPPLTAFLSNLNAQQAILGRQLYIAMANQANSLVPLMNAKNNPSAITNGWRDWEAHSKIVNEMIAELNQ